MDVSGLVWTGGAELGTNRWVPAETDLTQIAEHLAGHHIDGLLMAGGWSGYAAAHVLHSARHRYPALDLPIVCLPMTINNDLPGTELTIGSDTALNSIIADVDKIKQSAVATRRCFVVEVMGHDCGYLALMSGLATGAERVYLPEEGITLDALTQDVRALAEGFRAGKRLGLVIRSEDADPVYTTGFIRALFEKEGGGLCDSREAILGHIQEGGNPSPFDRIRGHPAHRPLHRVPGRAAGDRRAGERDGRRAVRPRPVHRPDLLPDDDPPRRAATGRAAVAGPAPAGPDHGPAVEPPTAGSPPASAVPDRELPAVGSGLDVVSQQHTADAATSPSTDRVR